MEIQNYNTVELSQDDLLNVQGGALAVVLAAATIFGGACLLAYGAGYLYGSLRC